MSTLSRSLGLVLLAAGSVNAAAFAQGALGDGQALDRNRRVGSDGRNSPRAVENFASRNDIVTGNVAGGKEFRGTVGYTSAKAFRGYAGSDALFGFRSGSALSALPAVMGGMTSDRYSLANDNVLLYSRDTTPPPLTGAVTGSRTPTPIDARAVIDRASVTGTTSQLFSRTAGGSVVGGARDADGNSFTVIGSPITGIRYEPMERNGVRAVDVGLYDWRGLTRDRADGVSARSAAGELGAEERRPGEQPVESPAGGATAADGGRSAGGPADSESGGTAGSANRVDARRLQNSTSPQYDEIVRQLIDRYGADPTARVSVQGSELQAALRAELDRLSTELGALAPAYDKAFPGIMSPTTPRPSARPGPLPSTPADGVPFAPEIPETPEARGSSAGGTGAGAGGTGAGAAKDGSAPGTEKNTEKGTETSPKNSSAQDGEKGSGADGATKPPRMSLEEMAGLLRRPEVVQRLSTDQVSQANELVRRGESLLEKGEYFFAEQTFDRALRIAPGHPMAMAGLIHSELGAGLYLSAAVQLRRFFAAQPAMVGTKYAANLLPTPARLKTNAEAIRTLLRNPGRDRTDYALVLAYIGFQSGDIAAMREGLDQLTGDSTEDAMRLLLKKVWLQE